MTTELPPGIVESASIAQPLEYAGFWHRFKAGFVDGVILLPLNLLTLWGISNPHFLAYSLVLSVAAALFYEVYLVRRFGGTPGKLAVHLRILKLNGGPVGYREAFLRSAPDLIFGALLSVGLVLASLKMNPTEYHQLSITEAAKLLPSLAPLWYRPLNAIQNIWAWGELIVLLTNEKKRALHDFIAGTVVIVKPTQLRKT